jgi:hypothetical protein
MNEQEHRFPSMLPPVATIIILPLLLNLRSLLLYCCSLQLFQLNP